MCKRIFLPGEWQKIVPEIRGVFLNCTLMNAHLQCAVGAFSKILDLDHRPGATGGHRLRFFGSSLRFFVLLIKTIILSTETPIILSTGLRPTVTPSPWGTVTLAEATDLRPDA